VRVLRDTHVWLWILAAPERLSRAGRSRLGDPAHQFYFSAASVWDIVIKQGLGCAVRVVARGPFC